MDKLLFGPQLENEIIQKTIQQTRFLSIQTVSTEAGYVHGTRLRAFTGVRFKDKILFSNSDGELIDTRNIDTSSGNKGLSCADSSNHARVRTKDGLEMSIDNKLFFYKSDCETYIDNIKKVLFPDN